MPAPASQAVGQKGESVLRDHNLVTDRPHVLEENTEAQRSSHARVGARPGPRQTAPRVASRRSWGRESSYPFISGRPAGPTWSRGRRGCPRDTDKVRPRGRAFLEKEPRVQSHESPAGAAAWRRSAGQPHIRGLVQLPMKWTLWRYHLVQSKKVRNPDQTHLS